MGLADGRIRILAEKPGSPGGLTVEEDWLAHEVGMLLITSLSCQTATKSVPLWQKQCTVKAGVAHGVVKAALVTGQLQH